MGVRDKPAHCSADRTARGGVDEAAPAYACLIEFGTSRTRAQVFMLTAAAAEEQNYVRLAHTAGKALRRRWR